MIATNQYFSAVKFVVMFKVAATFEYVDEIIKCKHSMKATGL